MWNAEQILTDVSSLDHALVSAVMFVTEILPSTGTQVSTSVTVEPLAPLWAVNAVAFHMGPNPVGSLRLIMAT